MSCCPGTVCVGSSKRCLRIPGEETEEEEVPQLVVQSAYAFHLQREVPSQEPSHTQTNAPNKELAQKPTHRPTKEPSHIPAHRPTKEPTHTPTHSPIKGPTHTPTHLLSQPPSQEATQEVSQQPSQIATQFPSQLHSPIPSQIHSQTPTQLHSQEPSKEASDEPTQFSSQTPSLEPSLDPSQIPSQEPSLMPTVLPSLEPSLDPSLMPTLLPSLEPSLDPSLMPTLLPTLIPSMEPTVGPLVFAETVAIVPDEDYVLPLSDETTLCTLTLKKVTATNKTISISHLGRSYDGHDWEAVAGPYNLNFDCNDFNCSTVFPLAPSDTIIYQITTYNEPNVTLSFEDKAARFLEQTTFGPTTETIHALSDGISSDEDLNAKIKQWISHQIIVAPTTYHREHFRAQTTTRYVSTERVGSPLHPCAAKTRWHSYTFTNQDRGAFVEVTKTSDNSRFLLSVNGIPRTEVESAEVARKGALVAGSSYKICMPGKYIGPFIGSEVKLLVSGSCVPLIRGNPPIKFSSQNPRTPPNTLRLSPNRITEFTNINGDFENDDFYHSRGLNEAVCTFLHVGAYPVYLDFTDGNWLALDPRINLLENSLESAVSDGGGDQERLGAACSNVPQTFLNIDSCTLSTEAGTCSAYFNNPDTEIPLTEENIVRLHELTNDYVYAVRGLRPNRSPCHVQETARWELVDRTVCMTSATIDLGTKNTLKLMLQNQRGEDFRETVYLPHPSFPCNIGSSTPTDNKVIAIELNSMCWKLIHPDENNVFDVTHWAEMHPGGPEKIKQFASRGEAVLQFPSSHEMSRWDQNKDLFNILGRFGNSVLFKDLPLTLQLESVAEEYGAAGKISSGAGVLVCGSPGEVANDHTFIHNKYNMRLQLGRDERIHPEFFEQKLIVWTMLALESPDQLRQRVAWILYQIFAVSPVAIKDMGQTELHMAYYDIFVKHAFGNYRDIMKGVSYSPGMAKMLTYHQNKCAAYTWELIRKVNLADENYAREIMQLFSIGIVMLEMDGTPKLDPETNAPILSYTNEHIMSFARAWTGFEFQNIRGNIEIFSTHAANLIDPMRILPEWRDVFPKINLLGGYIGDGYPLCVDLPEKNFLRKGAKYRLLGTSSRMELHTNPPAEIEDPAKSLRLGTTSKLYNKLCNPSSVGGADCNWKSEVVLDEHIDCDGRECAVETLRLVQVTRNIFYEYVPPPCVRFPFFDNAKKIANDPDKQRWKNAMCADPRLMDASELCCRPSEDTPRRRNNQYAGERMTYDTATQRCNRIDRISCPVTKMRIFATGCCPWLGNENYFWHDAPCEITAKIDTSGNVAIVHSPDPDNTPDWVVTSNLQSDTFNFVTGYWNDDIFPSLSNQCGNEACETMGESCICKTKVEESVVFTSMPPNVNEILAQLHVGSFSPDIFDLGTYNNPLDNGVIKAYLTDSNSYDTNTIFEVEVLKKKKYFRNVRSSVLIMDMNGQKTSFSFRNPPQFMSMVEPNVRDAQYETDAVLDDYFYHPNTAPFLAKYFIQRFGISNPSPRYVKTAALAFKDGSYEGFGSGEYGDLGALVTAVLLDREARSTVAAFDPTHGSLREPLLKFIGFMRSMKYTNFERYPTIRLKGMTSAIGQMAHEIESVFSFFEQDFAPGGLIKDAKLVAPEAQRYQTLTMIGLMNGLFSLTKYGLTNCFGGLAPMTVGNCGSVNEGVYSRGIGRLTFSPTDPSNVNATVDELATLLTAGRLNPESRKIISEEYSKQADPEDGLRIAQQLIVSTPEFHSTNLIRFSGEKQELPTPKPQSNRPFKSVTYLFLSGGVDSYNILIPHSGCPRGKDMYAEYAEIRANVALEKNKLLAIPTTGQICRRFGINPKLPILRSLYNAGDAIFFANTGFLFEHVTKEDWKAKTLSQLFAHNIQQRDTMQVDAFQSVAGTGVFGRMSDALTADGLNVGSFAVSQRRLPLVGESGKSPSIYSVGTEGLSPFNERPSTSYMPSTIADVNNVTIEESGFFAMEWSKLFNEALTQTDTVLEAMDGIEPTMAFPDTDIGQQLKMVTRVIKARQNLKMDRQFFMAEMGGYDAHSKMNENLDENLPMVNNAIDKYVQELKAQGVWDSTILILASEFGRTLNPNGGEGTDHAWGGNYFMIGGGLNGGRILGKYPDSFHKDAPHMLTRGRVIPSLSWESIMNGVAEWLDITGEDKLNALLPNRKRFRRDLFKKGDLFE